MVSIGFFCRFLIKPRHAAKSFDGLVALLGQSICHSEPPHLIPGGDEGILSPRARYMPASDACVRSNNLSSASRVACRLFTTQIWDKPDKQRLLGGKTHRLVQSLQSCSLILDQRWSCCGWLSMPSCPVNRSQLHMALPLGLA